MTGLPGLQITFGAHTDTGRRRAVNEDAFLAELPVFIVADGMGGHEAGDRASAAVVEVFRSLIERAHQTPTGEVSADDVARAVETAHSAVASIAVASDRGAGSTLTGVVAVRHDGQPRWLVVNIGDSRVYRLLLERLEQVTIDHSVAQEAVDAGRITREQMSTFQGRNVITRAVGEERSRADYWLLPIVTGERLLICSDGLTGELTDEALRAGLTLGGAPGQTAFALVSQAVSVGGRDNVTAIVVDVVGGGLGASSEEITGGLSSSASATLEVATAQSVRRRRG